MNEVTVIERFAAGASAGAVSQTIIYPMEVGHLFTYVSQTIIYPMEVGHLFTYVSQTIIYPMEVGHLFTHLVGYTPVLRSLHITYSSDLKYGLTSSEEREKSRTR